MDYFLWYGLRLKCDRAYTVSTTGSLVKNKLWKERMPGIAWKYVFSPAKQLGLAEQKRQAVSYTLLAEDIVPWWPQHPAKVKWRALILPVTRSGSEWRALLNSAQSLLLPRVVVSPFGRRWRVQKTPWFLKEEHHPLEKKLLFRPVLSPQRSGTDFRSEVVIPWLWRSTRCWARVVFCL